MRIDPRPLGATTSLMPRAAWQMTGLMLIILTGVACVHDGRHRYHHDDYYSYHRAGAYSAPRYHSAQPQPVAPIPAPVIVIPQPAPPPSRVETPRFTLPPGSSDHHRVHRQERHEHRGDHRDRNDRQKKN